MTDEDLKFAQLYGDYYGHVFAYCRRRLPPDRVEDAVADTFLTVWRRIDDVPADEGALPWLYRVAYRVIGHAWRGASRRKKLDQKLSSIGVESGPPADEFVVVNQEAEQVLEAAARLGPRDQEILRLAMWEQLDRRHIAQVVGVSTGAVKQRLHRAKKNLTREYNRLEAKRVKSVSPHKGGAW